MRRSAVLIFGALATLAGARAASAKGMPSCDQAPAKTEVEAWIAMGGGQRDTPLGSPTPYFEIAADLAATFPLSDAVRIGPWARLGTTVDSFDPGGGAHLVVAPTRVDWFYTTGRIEITLDVGAGYSFRGGVPGDLYGDQAFGTGRLSFGFRAPLQLYNLYPRCECGPPPSESPEDDREPWICRPKVGMVSGVRVYGGVRRSLHGKEVWEASFGLSFELLGSTWFLAGAN